MRLEVEADIPSRALELLKWIVRQGPKTQISTAASRKAAQAIANHLIFLIQTASDANEKGRHSIAVCLFRNMEDALDCFGAVALTPGSAERWAEGNLKASQAAELYGEGPTMLPDGNVAEDYRKDIRSFFNHYAHCTPHLTAWDCYPYFEPADLVALFRNGVRKDLKADLRVNTDAELLCQNAIRIGAYLVAHTVEFLQLVAMAYEDFLAANTGLQTDLENIEKELRHLLESNWTAVYLETPPPQIKNPRVEHPDDPDRVMELNLPDQA